MTTVVEEREAVLKGLGEYVVKANADSGWFAINPNTWAEQLHKCKDSGRIGPNLIVYRTKSGMARDHHVVPFQIISAMLKPESLKLQKNGTYRWNCTLSDDRLHVTHRDGYEAVGRYLAAPLLGEEVAPGQEQNALGERVVLRAGAPEGVLEGIARETVVLSRSRSAVLRKEALKISGGLCACCGVDFSLVLDGMGLRALQVHHRRQLALRETPGVTTVADLAVVCANCHAIIHTNPKKAIPVEELRQLWLEGQSR